MHAGVSAPYFRQGIIDGFCHIEPDLYLSTNANRSLKCPCVFDKIYDVFHVRVWIKSKNFGISIWYDSDASKTGWCHVIFSSEPWRSIERSCHDGRLLRTGAMFPDLQVSGNSSFANLSGKFRKRDGTKPSVDMVASMFASLLKSLIFRADHEERQA